MNKTKIDWPGLTHTWNPITGCKNGCYYCYAKKIWKRFHEKHTGHPFDKILVHDERFEKAPPPSAKRVFVGSMSDLEYWPIKALERVLDYCANYPEVEFMFLTKSASAYLWLRDKGVEWPENTMQGLTVEKVGGLGPMLKLTINTPRPYLSVEPLLGSFGVGLCNGIELVIVGAMTGPGAVPVEKAWVQSIRRNVPKTRLWFKSSMKEYL